MSRFPAPSRRFDRIGQRLGKPDNRIPPSYGSHVGMYLAGEGYAPPSFGTRNYAREVGRIDLNGIVRICLRWYQNAITQAIFRVGKRITEGPETGEYDINETHPLNAILTRPNPVMSYRETWTKVIAGYLIDDNAYLIIVRNNRGEPMELWWVPGWQMEIQTTGNSREPVQYYRVKSLDGGWIDYAPDDVLHIRGYLDDENPIIGIGALKSFLEYLAALRRGGQYTDRALRRGNTGIVLMPPAGQGGYSYGMTDVEEAQMLAHKRRLDQGLARDDDTAVIALTSHLNHEKIGFTPEEMTIDRILDRPEAYICAAMGLSPLLLDLPSARDSKTYANKGEARRAAWEDSLIPILGVISEAVQGQVLYRYDRKTGNLIGQFGDPEGLEVWADTSEVPAMQEDRTEKANYWLGLVADNVVTREYAASQLDIPEEAIPEEEPIPEEILEAKVVDEDEPGAGDDAPPSEPDDGDEEDDDDEPVKSRRGKGGGTAPRVPSEVRAAAARVAKGKPTSGDQKILDKWKRRNEQRDAKPIQSPEQMKAKIERIKGEVKPKGEVEFVASAPRTAAERKLVERAQAEGKQAIVIERSPVLKETEQGGITTLMVGNRVSTRVYQTKSEMPDVPKGSWVNHHEGSWVFPHRSRDAALRDARKDAQSGVKEETTVERLRARGLTTPAIEDNLPEAGWQTTFRLLSGGGS